MTSVALIGNFVVPYTTESYLARALQENGCSVTRIPQDDAYAIGPGGFALDPPDICLYTRTHNRTALGPEWTREWRNLEAAGTITASFHLDRFFDLEREHLIGDGDPLFTTQHVFTADGGNDDRFAAAGINHHWLAPAVDRYEAEMGGTANPDLAYDVVFVGSGGTYHHAYPQRAALLDHLRRTYRGRFAHFGVGGDRPSVRQQQLNDVYASARVVVGDSCFANEAGSPRNDRYWSDRIPETVGRGGFLLHPYVPGIRAHGLTLATYLPGDWEDLDTQIGAYLANPGDRATMIQAGRRDVLARHTYTHRVRTLLETVGLAPDRITG